MLFAGMYRRGLRQISGGILCTLLILHGRVSLAQGLSDAEAQPAGQQQSSVEAEAGNSFPVNPPSLRVNQFIGIEDKDNFVVGPMRFVAQMKPGEEKTFDFTILNKQGETIVLALSKEDFRGEPGTGFPQFFEYEGPFPATKWLFTEVDQLTLEHGQMATIAVLVKVPERADPGDHMAAVIVERVAQKKAEGGGFQVKPRIAVQFIISVEGNTIRQAQVSSFSAARFWNWSLPIDFSVLAHNRGTVHVAPSGTIDIRNFLGTTVDTITVGDWYVLRDSMSSRSFSWDPHFALGYYTATLDIELLEEQEPISLTLAFVVLPLIPLLIVLAITFAASFLVQIFFSRFEIRSQKAGKKKERKEDTGKT